MRSYVVALLALSVLSCSRSGGGGNAGSGAQSAQPAAPPPPVRTGGSMEIAMREFGADAPRATTMTIGPAYASVSGGRLGLVLFNDQATGTSCASLMQFGGRVSGTGWSLLIDNGEGTFAGNPGRIERGRININHPREGGGGGMRTMESPITIREVSAGSVSGEIDAVSESGAIRVRGTFVAQRCGS